MVELTKRRRWVRGVLGTADAEEIEGVVFAGFGGADVGVEVALGGKSPAFAINHDPYAIELHKLNHPNTHHFCCDVREVDPRKVFPQRAIGLMHFSPDCTHFSNAKGGTPVSREIRALANVVVTWLAARRPRVVVLENVPEFLSWGPLTKVERLNKKTGQVETVEVPNKAKAGQHFRRWRRAIERMGYTVDWRVLRAADYGAPTIRKRLFIVCRCDGQAITWPAPSHAPADRAELLGLKPWVPAAACIDWSKEGVSIFDRKRPLARNTMRRLAKGTVKHVLRSKGGPFLIGRGGPVFAGKPVAVDQPLGTVLRENHRAIAEPFLSLLNHSGESSRASSLDQPMRTLTSAHDAHGLTAIFLQGCGGRDEQRPPRSPEEPARTVTGIEGEALSAAFLEVMKGTATGADLRDPSPTIQAQGTHVALVRCFLKEFYDDYDKLTDLEKLGIVEIQGQLYQITDITLRMLEPEELLRCQFGEYAEGYILTGSKRDRVAVIGNSVCPAVEAAVVKANYQPRQWAEAA